MVYFFVAIVLFLFSLSFENRKYSKKQLSLICLTSAIFLALFEGLRWEIGTDWDPYYQYFRFLDNEHNEIGYYYITKAIRLFTDKYTFYLLLQAFFFYLTFAAFIIKHSDNPGISLTILYCSFLPFWGCNRQFLALTIIILSIDFVLRRKFLPFFLCVAIATSMHTTAIIFAPVYFLYNFQYKSSFVVVASIVAIYVGAMGYLNNIPYLNLLAYMDDTSGDKMMAYLSKDITGSFSIPGAMRRLLIVIGGLYVRPRIKDKTFDYFLIVYTIGAIIYLLFISTQLQLIAGRGVMYFTVMEIVLVPQIIRSFTSNKSNRVIIWSVYFAILLYLLNRDLNYYYLMSGEEIFRPYKTIFN